MRRSVSILSGSSPWGPPLLLLLLGGLWVHSACAGSHSLRYLKSLLTPTPHKHEWHMYAGFVNDVQLFRFNPESRRKEPCAPWVEFRDSEEETDWGKERVFHANLSSALHNQTEDRHVFQELMGCELWDDGFIEGFLEQAWDGQDFMHFDIDRMIFVAGLHYGKRNAGAWNYMNYAEKYKVMLEISCIENLKAHLRLGEEILSRRVRPEFRVSLRNTDAGVTLTCYAYGFYPRAIDMKWVRNGVEMPWKSKKILPHPDGTYQMKTAVEVYEGDDERKYTCRVEHSSFEETVDVVYSEYMSVMLGSRGSNWQTTPQKLQPPICLRAMDLKNHANKEAGPPV